MAVTGHEMRSTSRAGDDKTPSKRAGTSETPVISVHRLAPVTSRGAREWKCRTLGAAGSDCSPDFSFEDIDTEIAIEHEWIQRLLTVVPLFPFFE
jgi:hypothetical protein